MDARIDKWLWAVRIFKTRSKASEACRSGKVLINEKSVKSSCHVKINEIIAVKSPPIVRLYRVKGLAVKRVSAKLAADLVEEITPEEELEKLKQFWKDPVRFIFAPREKGTGRPTKRERRQLERLYKKK
jgi:ribosome-associated heat shock protein Hsp15